MKIFIEKETNLTGEVNHHIFIQEKGHLKKFICSKYAESDAYDVVEDIKKNAGKASSQIIYETEI